MDTYDIPTQSSDANEGIIEHWDSGNDGTQVQMLLKEMASSLKALT